MDDAHEHHIALLGEYDHGVRKGGLIRQAALGGARQRPAADIAPEPLQLISAARQIAKQMERRQRGLGGYGLSARVVASVRPRVRLQVGTLTTLLGACFTSWASSQAVSRLAQRRKARISEQMARKRASALPILSLACSLPCLPAGTTFIAGMLLQTGTVRLGPQSQLCLLFKTARA